MLLRNRGADLLGIACGWESAMNLKKHATSGRVRRNPRHHPFGRVQGLRGGERCVDRNLLGDRRASLAEDLGCRLGQRCRRRARHLRAAEAPDLRGFSPSNLGRMKQFYETYSPLPKLATLLRELSWSKHLLLLSHCKSEEENEFLPALRHTRTLVASRTRKANQGISV